MCPSHLHQRPNSRSASDHRLSECAIRLRADHRVHGGDPPSSPINIPLASPLIVTVAQPVGLHVDFDLAQVDPGRLQRPDHRRGHPNFDVNAVGTGDPAPTSTSSTRPLSGQHHGAGLVVKALTAASSDQRDRKHEWANNDQHHPALHQQHRADLGHSRQGGRHDRCR